MKAAEIMAKPVVTIGPDATVREVAEKMASLRITGLPVVDANGRLVGILSETDLLHRVEVGTERRRKWWLTAFTDADTLAREYAQSHAVKVKDIMSTNVVTVDAAADLGSVAELLERRKLKRAPVLEDGKVVGIITRSDLVRALVARMRPPEQETADAATVSRAIKERMTHETWLDTSLVAIDVSDGTVTLTGLVNSIEQQKALRILVEATPGVRSVEDKLRLKPRSVAV